MLRGPNRINMKRPTLPQSVVAFGLAAFALCAGCNRNAASASRTQIAKPTPEERFQHVLESFRRRVQDSQIGFVVTDGTSRSTMVGHNEVTSKLIPPATAGDHYKAVITVHRESRYSYRHTASPTDQSEHDQNAKSQGTSLLDGPNAKKGISILEPDLAGKPRSDNSESAANPQTQQSAEDIVARQPDKEDRNFDLVYENDRWVLVTKTDPKTEQSIQFAFDEALANQ
jgi:hypothetical protein